MRVIRALRLLTLLAFVAFAVIRSEAATSAATAKSEIGISGQVITNPVAATFLTVPTTAQHAWITVKGNPVCWGMNADGTAPTATSGGEWPAGAVLKIDNDPRMLKSIRLINCAEGATVVKIYYTRDRPFGQ